MKKIGIITHYYNSINYGGVLQAYALTKVLQELGYNAEQICYDASYRDNSYKRKITIKSIVKKTIYKCVDRKLKKRYLKFSQFRNEEIKHSNAIYNSNNIEESNCNYEIFVTGSDQVWNLKWLHSAYFLDFVKNKKKVSYAASLGKKDFSDDELDYYKKKLKGFAAISLREKEGLDYIQKIVKVPVVQTLDPTLLLPVNEWKRLARQADRENNFEKYLFCYFIGDDVKVRKLATKYAKSRNLKIVNLPHAAGFNFSDVFFGNKKVYTAGPCEFIDLIKNAEVIMTDSFHCCVFANIFKKDFWVFDRVGKRDMNTRIYSLLDLFGNTNRFCDSADKRTIKYMSTESVDCCENEQKNFLQMKDVSMEFIKKYIN